MNRRRRKKLQQRLTEAAGWAGVERVVGLIRAGADPNTPGPGRSTPLYRASVQDRVDNVRVLLAAGADPNAESGTGEEGLPLCGAACWGHDRSVRVLLAAGADPNQREDNGSGRTAAQWAEAGGHRHTLELLTADHTATPGPTRRTTEAAGAR
ncbi:ankyrin repeat domain-containing protein [Paractinoplanes toevensis]|uniref:ankyrin repeat domain-containing protein n=1 Tax=Paractinoplanes toevensis TaxID=571911 RepID=UPI001BB43266|nr:ankyrin repeat domain-containing protein [Actinoplanes toevensis]